MKQLILCGLAFPIILFGATENEEWQKGKITDASTTLIQESKGTPGGAHLPIIDTQVLVIRSGSRTYIAQERHGWHNACLFIEGDEIKFNADEHQIRLMDSTGLVCKFDIVKNGKPD